MQLHGACHCKNISYVLQWPGEIPAIPVRECGCTFCTKHGGAWTSHRDAELSVSVKDQALLSRYRFGTSTADFQVCARCGVVPLVISTIDGRMYSVVNVNTFENVDGATLSRSATDFDGEGTEDRLERRRRNWIASVQVSGSSG